MREKREILFPVLEKCRKAVGAKYHSYNTLFLMVRKMICGRALTHDPRPNPDSKRINAGAGTKLKNDVRNSVSCGKRPCEERRTEEKDALTEKH